MEKYQTVGGYNFYHVVSAFQKYIRRGNQDKAMYFGTELLLSGYGKYAWYRMKVIASEDVGLANNDACVQVNQLYYTYMDMIEQTKKHAGDLAFCHAILILVRSEKSRIVDNLYCKFMDKRKKIGRMNIDDFCYDQFTDIGKRLGRGDEFFYDVSGVVDNVPQHLREEEDAIMQDVKKLYVKPKVKGLFDAQK